MNTANSARPRRVAQAKVGRCVGLPPFKNTNRANPLYRKRANRRARRHGFESYAHMTIFIALMAKQRAEAAGA